MPKIKRKYYVYSKSIADASINLIESIPDLSSSITNTSLVSNTNNDILYNERDKFVNTNHLNKKLDEELTHVHSDNYELINNDEEVFDDENNNVNDMNSYNNDDDALNPNFLNNLERCENDDISITSNLQGWAIRNRITHVALNELMACIKSKYPELPRDARTLLGTMKKVHLDKVEPGYYYHFGISHCVEKLVLQYPFQNLQTIEIIINIDGLPLSKSSGSQVYPILCSLVNNYNNVGIIGIYHGYKKPANANKFLQSFIKEAQDLITQGVTINGIVYPFKIKAFICDVPALSFIKYTKGHSGYYSCTKCEAKGEYHFNKVCFPYLEILNVRTDTKFRLKSQPDHHTGTSILEQIPNIDMIYDFPSDPMHLLFLGEVKKIVVSLWYHGKPRAKLSSQQLSVISTLLEEQRYNIPCDFNRKSRSLLESKRWKATEYRTFLLYTGPVVLKSVLSHDKYLNFITLHAAVTILSSSKHIELYLDYAKLLLQYYVETFISLYGKENVSHNTHHLLHLCDDVKKFGPLQEFSAFPFENYMQSILKMIRKHDKPLEQIVCRISEQNNYINPNVNITSAQMVQCNKPQLLNPHFNGPLVNCHNYNQFNKIVFKKFVLTIKEPDNCCCLLDGSIIVIQNFATNNENTIVIGNKYKTLKDFYTKPCQSSKFDIYEVCNLGNLQIWNLDQIANKCVRLKYKNRYVIFPLVHAQS
ncbi:PREDICTED: uncharacterized protein LOC105450548 [Wasmannia auropunctata]|uniref:uncharacterized protein LOC105450548 n=1 Tax=Wasmannia auropunctata TaxID=64793 RepID=UPI0005EE9B58|nr:PREDICTED: uncharacterized protein LOC105450548 [Wasmannia auropunctata]